MLSYFCDKCGGKNLYQFQKPKFCSNCGHSFSTDMSSFGNIKTNKFEVNIVKPTNVNKNNIIEDIDCDSSFISDYSSMRGLDVNIEKYNKNEGVKLGDLVSDEPPQKQIGVNKKQDKQRRGRKKINKSLPESFISEAKMSGRNYQNYEDPNIIDNEQ
jgi:ribosomal protein L37E